MRNSLTTLRAAWLGAGLVLGIALAAGTQHATAAARKELRVVPVNKIGFGERGAVQYQALVQALADDGWRYDHAIPGFVVFRR